MASAAGDAADTTFSGSAASRYADKPIPFPTSKDNLPSFFPKSYKDIAPGDHLSNEPLVNLSKLGIAGDNYYARKENNPPYNGQMADSNEGLWARQSVAEKLQKVNEALKPLGYEVYLRSAKRDLNTQKAIFDHFVKEAGERFPDKTEDERKKWAKQIASDPSGFDKDHPRTWLDAMSGGTVEGTMRNLRTGKLVNMGVNFDDNLDKRQETAYFEHPENIHGQQDIEARNMRRTFYKAMTDAGLTPNPKVQGLFSYGTQQAVRNQMLYGQKPYYQPFYGPADRPEDEE
jgi:D-alanyl-D-alanine dipeptidase